MSYAGWKALSDLDVDLRPIEYSGHGSRNAEPLLQTVEDLIDDIYHHISSELDDIPYAILGHSMGALIAYELVRKIQQEQQPEPAHLFFSAKLPPYIDNRPIVLSHLNDVDFLDVFIKLGGINKDFIENKEVVDYILPILRSDCKIIDTYIHPENVLNCNCDITILYGNQDIAYIPEDIEKWKFCTEKQCDFHVFDGDHFFIHKLKTEVLGTINRVLSDIYG